VIGEPLAAGSAHMSVMDVSVPAIRVGRSGRDGTVAAVR